MYVAVDYLAEILDVDHTTIRRWVQAAGLNFRSQKRGNGRHMVPVRALLNYLIESEKLPFSHVEKECCDREDYEYPQIV